jgi:hypothetical protein
MNQTTEIKIKPLSVNEAWKGRRFKTDKYKRYERELPLLLSSMTIPDGPLELWVEFGFSSAASDWDNPIKPFQDILQKKYGFNDSRITLGCGIKRKVKKGEEFIRFSLIEHSERGKSNRPSWL